MVIVFLHCDTLMARPECFWMINELLFNLEGDPVSSDSSYFVHLVDYCLLSVKTKESSRDFLFQDMLFIPTNAYKSTKIDYIITSNNSSSITLPFKIEEGYSMSAKPLALNDVDNSALKEQRDNLALGKTIFVGDNTKGVVFKPSDINSLKSGLDSDIIRFLQKVPPSERSRTYFLGTEDGKDSIEFCFKKDNTDVKYQFTFLSGHTPMYKSVNEFNLKEYLSPLN